ncbi:MAG: PTS sugar transporter subunit IIA [Candidatus Omnitrophica bacterium]|nr:PTS sugar transporter subunit IIA [Candidatus Omnitrophota bacterium]
MKLTVKEVTHLFDVSANTIYRWIKEDGFPAYRLKERYRFNPVDILEWAIAKKVPYRPELAHMPDRDAASVEFSNSLVQALEVGGVHYKVPNHSKASVIRAVVGRLPLPDDVDREFALQMFLARENLGSTALGDGIAIPHPRNPLVFHVDHPLLTLCFLESPVDFDAIDRQPVHTVFALVCPTIKSHLILLSRLAFALKDAAFRRLITARGSREDLLTRLRHLESQTMDGSRKKKT